MMPGEKAKDFKGTMKTLLSYLKPYRIAVAVVFIFAIASTIFNIISPTILGDATDEVVKGLMSKTGIDFGALLQILIFLIILYGLSFAFSTIQGYIMAGVSQKIIYSLRRAMSEKMDRLPLKYFDSKTHGEIQSRVVNDIETVNQTLSQSLTQVITSITTIIGILVMMIRINLLMTITALVVLPLSMLIIRLIISKTQVHFKNQQRYLGEVNSHVEEMYTGHTIVKAFNQEENSEEVFDHYNEKLYESAWKSQFLSGLMMPLTNFVGNLAYVAVCILGGHLALKGTITIGNIQAFIQYVRSFNQPVAQVANVANLLQSTAAAAERVFEFIAEEEEDISADVAADGSSAHTLPLNREILHGEVSFEHVGFGYNDNELIIKDFNFNVKPGQRVAIVGPTGAGKTTIVKLLLRFYELNRGRITVDGHDIKDYSRKDLRSIFGMVLQDTWLFSGTVRENIRYGKMTASDDEVAEAAKAAHIHHFIKTQPKGYDMEINEEASNISQGQKQLLTIARAILADTPILILDEATSSVDTRTETLIQKAMANLMEGRTSFIIAHRLSTIRDADMILVMNHGDIIEQGTHEDLLAKDGFYANLYNSQFSGE
ncbi:ABC transporter ATP-binding protein/permease [Ihubacter massiliensis]|uniref:ABC transporter ATP-binding protein/permease n=2 Tax=Hominibacterium faecale TaxID=2839743 RepID=A0A9J6QSG9_9FIRM|nr:MULTISPECIES: ABC transporter ATP-binding protein [Eubacteriales Family XIII. Incertae Sedis]MCO7123131.1 ABC transporter ATP-binding protein/permease [Ihubacter massiliensis]MCU7377391.1 ABC transporter ATP-binding protein/permease [Hominibacterium faecale]